MKVNGKNMNDNINRQKAIRDIRLMDVCVMYDDMCSIEEAVEKAIVATKRNAIFGLEHMPSAEPERHYCRECKWSRCHINLDKYGRSETYWHCLNWDGGTDEEGFCHEWERRIDG